MSDPATLEQPVMLDWALSLFLTQPETDLCQHQGIYFFLFCFLTFSKFCVLVIQSLFCQTALLPVAFSSGCDLVEKRTINLSQSCKHLM